jgi:SAM-dependent methyltransferase
VSEYDAEAFDAFEAAGWESVAAFFTEHWSRYTSQVVDPLLDAVSVEQGTRVLDVGTGSGDAAGRAAERGAEATGIDVAAAMVEIAARQHPRARFIQASATDLPFADDSFDAAVGNMVVPHIGEPARAMREIERVLVPTGRVALSTWDAPERSPFFAALLGAVHDAEIPPPSDVPPGPSFFQFADEAAFRALLEDAGFAAVETREVRVEFTLLSAEDAMKALAEGTVRMGALVRAADDAEEGRVRRSLEAAFEQWRQGDSYVVPASVRIASGRTAP